MSCNYHRDCNGWKVNTPPGMIWNDTKLSQLVRNDVNLILHRPTSQRRSEKGRSFSLFPVNAWTNEYFVFIGQTIRVTVLSNQCFGTPYRAPARNCNESIERSAPNGSSA